MHDLKGRDFISLADFSPEEIRQLLDAAHDLKRQQKLGLSSRPLMGRTLAMLFHKHSTRTRVSFAVGMYQLGGQALYLGADELQLGRGETVADTARVLSRYVDAILIRTYAHELVLELAQEASVPVINGLTDLLHPTQALADFFTLEEKKGRLAGLKLAYVGDGNNVAHSLLIGAAKLGVNISLACPPGYGPKEEIVAIAREAAAGSGAAISIGTDPQEAVAGADAVYTDVWTSMGQEAESGARRTAFASYQVNAALMALAKPDAVFLHCLPCHRGEEVTAEVVDGPWSVVFDEAENRLHVHKAILAALVR
ncbi:MAG: ornithine carbamoyltransferase [Bacillota bacterium]|jgi:ornithine carbamoyltransferase|nr:ornithine carbamoyltransferase [Bacillota bacterium]